MSTNDAGTMVVASTKGVGTSVLLAALFGPLGMFYSTILGAIIMLVISVPLALITVGFSLIITWPICLLWAGLAASSHNKKLISGKKQF